MAIDIIASVVPDIDYADPDCIRFYVYLTPRISCSGWEPLENFRQVYNWTDYFWFFENFVQLKLSFSNPEEIGVSVDATAVFDRYRGDIRVTRDWRKAADPVKNTDKRKWAKTIWRSLVNKSTPVNGWELDKNAYKLLSKLDQSSLNELMNRAIIAAKQRLLSTSLRELGIPGFYDTPEDEEEQRGSLLAILDHLLRLSPDRKLASPYINNPSKAVNFPSFLKELHDKLDEFDRQRRQQANDLALRLTLKQVEQRNSTETNEFHKKMAAFGNFPFLLKQTGWIWSYEVDKKEFCDAARNNVDCYVQVQYLAGKQLKSNPAGCCNNPDLYKDFTDNVRISYPFTAIKIDYSAGVAVDYGFKPIDKDFPYLSIENGLIDTGLGHLIKAQYLERNQVFDRITQILQQKYKFSYNQGQAADSNANQQSLQSIAANQTPQNQQEIDVLNHERVHAANVDSGRLPTTDYNSVGVAVSLQNLKDAIQTAVTNSPGLNLTKLDKKVQERLIGSAVLFGHNLHKGYRVDVFPPAAGSEAEFSMGRSLCKRRTYYTIDFKKLVFEDKDSFFQYPGCIVDEDEGWIVESAQGSNSGSLYVDGELFRYNDWSLCADKLFKSTDDGGNAGELSIAENSNIRLFSIPVEGSLPRLRFGHAYRIVLRYVDICGSGRSLILKPGGPDDGTYPSWYLSPCPENQSTELSAYPRTQGVSAPLAFLGQHLHKGGRRSHEYLDHARGEDLVTLVIRSEFDADEKKFVCRQQAIRYVAPPKLDFHLVKKHGVLDALMARVATGVADSGLRNASEKIMSLTVSDESPKRLNQQEDDREEVVKDTRDIDYLFDPLVNGYKVYVDGVRDDDWSLTDGVIDTTLDCTNYGKTYLDGVKYVRVTLTTDDSTEAYDYDIKPDGYDRRISLQQGMEKMVELQSSLFKLVKTPDFSTTGLPVGQLLYNGDIAVSRLKLQIVHAVQKPCLLYVRVGKSNFLPQYPAEISVSERPLGSTVVNIAMGFDLFPCLTAEAYVLHATYIDRISYRNRFFPDGTLNERGYQLVEVSRIIKTGINPDRPGIEQAVAFSGLSHTFNDSRYRRVFYQLEAVSRYKKYFPADTTDFSVFGADPRAEAPKGDEIKKQPEDIKEIIKTWLPVLSSNQPPALTVDRIVPLMRWEGSVDGGGLERKCDTIRIYLEGEWYTTGGHDDESVAIFFIERNFPPQKKVNSKYVPRELENVISQMGVDPATDYKTTLGSLPLIDRKFFFESTGTILPLVTFVQSQKEVLIKIANLDFENNGGNPYCDYYVTAAIYKVLYMPPGKDEEQGRFYIDVRIDREDLLRQLYFPFIRFAMARYQEHTVNTVDRYGNGIDSRFSKVTVTDFVQLLPYRKLAIDAVSGGLVYTAPATRRSYPDSDGSLKSNLLVYLKGENRLESDENLVDLHKPDTSHEGDFLHAGDTVVAEKDQVTDRYIVEEYEHYSNDQKLAAGTKAREDFTKRLIFTYSHSKPK